MKCKLLKMLIVLCPMILSLQLLAHDEGHGPKLNDSAKYGGIIASVIDAKESNHGHHAELVYKAELLKSEDGKVTVYLYDHMGSPVDMKRFDKTANGVIEAGRKKKKTKSPFSLNLEGNSFVAAGVKAASKPFNMEIKFKEGSRDLLVEFHDLD